MKTVPKLNKVLLSVIEKTTYLHIISETPKTYGLKPFRHSEF